MNGFIKLQRGYGELIKARPSAFLLLCLIAERARRSNEPRFDGLEIGESFIGDYESYGGTEQIYRDDKEFLQKHKIATFRRTNRGTIAKLISTEIFDINVDEKNDQKNDQRTDRERTENEQRTTKEEVKKERNKEERNSSKELVIPDKGDPRINEVIDYLVVRSELPALDGTIVQNRRYAKLLLDKLKKTYPDNDEKVLAKQLIDVAYADKFHAEQATKMAYMYYNMGKIINSAKTKSQRNSVLVV